MKIQHFFNAYFIRSSHCVHFLMHNLDMIALIGQSIEGSSTHFAFELPLILCTFHWFRVIDSFEMTKKIRSTHEFPSTLRTNVITFTYNGYGLKCFKKLHRNWSLFFTHLNCISLWKLKYSSLSAKIFTTTKPYSSRTGFQCNHKLRDFLQITLISHQYGRLCVSPSTSW